MITEAKVGEDAQSFLKDNITAVVATSAGDVPRAATVYFLVDEKFNFYFITKSNTGAGENLSINPKAAIVVGTGPEHITVQASGECLAVTEGDEKERVMERFSEMFAREFIKTRPIADVYRYMDKDNILYRLTPKEVGFLNLDSTKYPDSQADNYMYITL